jgi:hypothetical protein
MFKGKHKSFNLVLGKKHFECKSCHKYVNQPFS